MTRWQETAAALEGWPHVPKGILAFLRSGWAPEYPTEVARGAGARVWDADGRELIDWVMGKGPVILGHGRPEVIEAASARAGAGALLPGIAPEYGALAERLAASVPAAESSVFAKNGSDAVRIALRLARVYTGRSWVLSAGYHGWDDRVRGTALADRAPHRGVSDFAYDLDALERALTRHGDEVAAVLVTPEPAFFGPELLRRAAALARAAGSLLITDEVRCGMRVSRGGAHVIHGVTPDLLTMSKGLANGYPLSVVAGRAEVLDASRETFVFGSYYAEAVSLAAALACFDVVEAEGSLTRLADAGRRLSEALTGALGERGVAARVLGPPSMPTVVFDDPADEDRFYAGAAAAGVIFFQDDAQCPSAAHGPAEVDETLQRIVPVLDALEARGELSDAALIRVAERRMIAPEVVDLAFVRGALFRPAQNR